MVRSKKRSMPRIDTRAHREFLRSEEGRLFVCGSIMLLLWIAGLASLWRLEYPIWDDILALAFAHLLMGRGISIAQGMQAGMPPSLITFLATYADITALLILYPLMVFSYKNVFEGRFFQKHMRPVFESAQKSVGRMSKFKIASVFLFVWFPFFMTGIVVGAVLGFLLGLRTWVNLTTVCLGALAAAATWAYAYDRLFSWLSGVNESLPACAVILMIVGLIAYRLVRRQRGLNGGGIRNANSEL